ncbi:MAG TPA: hypothetical protein VJB65_03640 [Patescibacteria group bacterium]|nr:hypothetical protein [Patescibacteria group bacterium]
MANDSLSDKNITRGYWVATHRKQIRLLKVSFWLLIASISVGTFFVFVCIWLFNIRQTNMIWSQIPEQILNINSIRQPQQIAITRKKAVQYNDTSVDILVEMHNPNTIWAATDVMYEILVDGRTTGQEHATFSPLQERYLIKTQIPFGGQDLPTVSVNIIDVDWKKMVDVSTLPDVHWGINELKSFPIHSALEDFPFRTGVSFTLQNKSVYGFRDIDVVVVLEDENKNVFGVGRVSLSEITSLESRSIDAFKWPNYFSSSVIPQIFINVDVLTEDRIIRKL